jgi:hypothetical protein
VAIALAKRLSRIVFASLERLAAEALFSGDKVTERLRTPAAENALESVAERVLAMVNSYHTMVVQGSAGTGALFQAAYQLRRANGTTSPGSSSYEELVASYDDVVRSANAALDEDVRLPYGTLKRAYDAQFEAARPVMFAIWESDYAPHVVRQTLCLLTSEFHQAGVLGDKELVEAMKVLHLGREAREALEAKLDQLDPPGWRRAPDQGRHGTVPVDDGQHGTAGLQRGKHLARGVVRLRGAEHEHEIGVDLLTPRLEERHA